MVNLACYSLEYADSVFENIFSGLNVIVFLRINGYSNAWPSKCSLTVTGVKVRKMHMESTKSTSYRSVEVRNT